MVNDVLAAIKRRRSIRAFTEAPVTVEEVQTVLEAAVYAPSAGNQQLWHFTVIQNQQLLADLNVRAKAGAAQIDNEHIQQLAKNEKFNIFYGASTVILVSGKVDGMAIEADCAAATQNILLAAESIGLGACWINLILFAFAGEAGKQFSQQLGLPPRYKPFYSVALGHKKVDSVNIPHRKKDVVNYIK
ncbi:nitroreductase family protein [Sporomusa acidovorans]|uniref:FMN reductase (NADPH) n=1 Tax=Sporomusa acidovorans (strain ATCC 49682 / DSM 3132 / Mol) TaxID=1123286 RepID=A0ABZ3IZM3_SPOA4|nr:nitroreductase family protein [Sporomusa acidovorans]OZC17219.1 FMN reductase (NADPH) [Sporomusa acidovorans DSM 3132]SDF15031.1 Nitroreductase [Sporomusa acidovorans]